MRHRLPIASGFLEVDIPDDRLIEAEPSLADHPPIDLRQSLVAAIGSPLGYPPLVQAILPGDHITIAVDPDLPDAVRIVESLIAALTEAGCDPEAFTVLVSQRQQAGSMPNVITHDPEDESAHSYLAATRDGRPVYLNRAIADADVMIPLGLQRLHDELDARGVHGGWFPAFSNLEMQHRFQSAGNVEWKTHQRRRREETDEAAWLLGTRLVIQVLPGPHRTIAGVWCGDVDEVARAAQRTAEAVWSRSVDRPADLVIATLDSSYDEQSWRQVARALDMASRAVNDGGAVVLWTDVRAKPGPALRSLAALDEDDDRQRLTLLKLRGADAMAAKIISDSLKTFRIYFHGQLQDSVVEEIGLTPLHNADELQRLADHADSCILFGSAQHAGLQVRSPVDAP